MSIEFENVGKRFGNHVALDGVSFRIEEGELCALLGPSGGGKTTLLRVLAGLETPDSGRVRLHGEDITTLGTEVRNMGFVFQHYALFRHLSVFENVAFGLRVKPRKIRPNEAYIQKRAQELLELVQLEGFRDRFPDQLSGGQKQRVALARALATEPRVLLLDEPFGALDTHVRHEIRAWLKRLQRELKITTVLVTHDHEEAFDVADRVAIIQRGVLEQYDSPAVVFHQPKTEFVRAFLGHMPTFRAVVDEHGGVRLQHVTLPPNARVGDSVRLPLHSIALPLHSIAEPHVDLGVDI